MIKTIIFDSGGVLGPDADEWEGAFKRIPERTGLSSDKIHRIFERHWPKLKIGEERMQMFWKEIARRAEKKVAYQELAKIYSSGIALNQQVFNVAKELKKRGFRLVILSNESKDGMETKIKKFHLRRVFAKIYCSAFLGMAKPDKAIFEYVLQDLGVLASEAIFIDNQENNIDVARNLKIRSILFKNLAQLKRELADAIYFSDLNH